MRFLSGGASGNVFEVQEKVRREWLTRVFDVQGEHIVCSLNWQLPMSDKLHQFVDAFTGRASCERRQTEVYRTEHKKLALLAHKLII